MNVIKTSASYKEIEQKLRHALRYQRRYNRVELESVVHRKMLYLRRGFTVKVTPECRIQKRRQS